MGMGANRFRTFFNECISLINELDEVDVFVSKAAEEVLVMYKKKMIYHQM